MIGPIFAVFAVLTDITNTMFKFCKAEVTYAWYLQSARLMVCNVMVFAVFGLWAGHSFDI